MIQHPCITTVPGTFWLQPGWSDAFHRRQKMSDKTEKPLSKSGGDTRPAELTVVMALLVVAITASIIMADSSKWDSSPTAIGTTVQW